MPGSRMALLLFGIGLAAGALSAQAGGEHMIDIGVPGDEEYLTEGFYQPEGPNEASKAAFYRENTFRWATNTFRVKLPVFPRQYNEVCLRMRFNGVLRLSGPGGFERDIVGLGDARFEYIVVLAPEQVGGAEDMVLRGQALNPSRPTERDKRTLYAAVDWIRVRDFDEDPGTETEWGEIVTEGPPIPVGDRLRGVEWRPTSHDPTAFVARLKIEGANQVTIGALNGLGYANYPSEYAVHSPAMKVEWIPEVTKALREAGLGILCWVPFNVQDLRNVEDFQMAKLHPEWTMKFIEEPGKAFGPRAGMCVISSPYIEWYANVLREVAAFDLDGIFFDGFYLGGIPHPSRPGCTCEHCEVAFRTDTGLALPKQVDWTDMAFKRWVRWRNERLLKTARYFTTAMREVNPELDITINFNLWPFGGKDWETGIPMWRIDDLACSQHAYTGDPSQEWMMLGFKSKLGRDISPAANDIWRFTAMPKNVEPTEAEIARHELRIRTFLLAGLTYGIKPWYGGPTNPPSIGRKAHEAVALRERYFARDQLCNVGVVCSQNTHDFYGHIPETDNLNDYRDSLIGTWMLLTENHIPFEFVFDNQLAAEQLARYDALVLPSCAAMSDEVAAELRDWMADGGNLVATAQTGVYDEWGNKRARPVIDFGEGQSTYIADDPGMAWARLRDRDLAQPLLDALTDVDLPIEVDAPSTLVVNPFRSPDGSEIWVHMLNYSAFAPDGEAGFRGLGRKPAESGVRAPGKGEYPPLVPAENVKIRINGVDVASARLVLAAQELTAEHDGTLTVPLVGDHEVLVVTPAAVRE